MTDKHIKALTDSIFLLRNEFDTIATNTQPAQTRQTHDLPVLTFEMFTESNEPFKCYKEILDNCFELKPTSWPAGWAKSKDTRTY